MNKFLLLTIFLFISKCSLNKVIQHHGTNNLEEKQAKLKNKKSNKNDIRKWIGPAAIKRKFKNEV